MKFFKYKAFTLAELMIIMTVLTILMAAFAPVFTQRQNISLNDVWTEVVNDENRDIYADSYDKNMIQASFIGTTPMDGYDVRKNYEPLSKLIIRSSDNISATAPQNQMDFFYNGTKTGSLFADSNRLLLGGPFSIPKTSDNSAVAIGSKAMSSNLGSNSTAIGYNSANARSFAGNNAVYIGTNNGAVSGNNNVFIGNSINIEKGASDSVYIGHSIGDTSSSTEDGIGNNAIIGASYVGGDKNVTVGYQSGAPQHGDTALGAGALGSNAKGKYNTAIGYNSCAGLDAGNYITCIGTPDVSKIAVYKDKKTGANRVFIGKPKDSTSAAAVEVHAVGGGNDTVIINGDLVVRGQPFLLGQTHYKSGSNTAQSGFYKSLMGYTLIPDTRNTSNTHGDLLLAGNDGTPRVYHGSIDTNFTEDKFRKTAMNIHEGCLCNFSNDSGVYNNAARTYRNAFIDSLVLWYENSNKTDFVNMAGTDYTKYLYSNYTFPDAYYKYFPHYLRTADQNSFYHTLTDEGKFLKTLNPFEDYSCCPILKSSDRRLKNVGDKFTAGLEELKKLKIYNFRFIFDKYKSPQVGVIAQDLKKVFPNAVTKDNQGYYHISWDEMFYAMINSVKQLNTKVNDLLSAVENDVKRIEKLKKDNERLKSKLSELSEELDKLEK